MGYWFYWELKNQIVLKISSGLLVTDRLRVFPDSEGVMNLSLEEAGGAVIIVVRPLPCQNKKRE